MFRVQDVAGDELAGVVDWRRTSVADSRMPRVLRMLDGGLAASGSGFAGG